jgi:hypothetical protein
MNKLVWQTGEPPKDRRVLVIGIPKDTGPQVHQEPEMVIGHWHHQHEDFVCAALAADLRKGVPPKFQVIYWAEIEPPPDIKLRPLTKRDTTRSPRRSAVGLRPRCQQLERATLATREPS